MIDTSGYTVEDLGDVVCRIYAGRQAIASAPAERRDAFQQCVDRLESIATVLVRQLPPPVAIGWDKSQLDPRAAAYAMLPGIYTVTTQDGTSRTYKLEPWMDRAKGQLTTTLVASYLSGPDNTSDYTGFAFIQPSGRVCVWKRYNPALGDTLRLLVAKSPTVTIEAAATCWRCGRLLTTPESLARGVGPVCNIKG